MNVERKGQDPFEFNNYSKFLFSANVIPRMKDKTGAVQRRLVIVPFDAKFTPNDADFHPFIKDALCEQSSMEYLILLGLKALRRVSDECQVSPLPAKFRDSLTNMNRTTTPSLASSKKLGLKVLRMNPQKQFTGSIRNTAFLITSKPFPTLNFHGKSPNAVGLSSLISGSAALENAVYLCLERMVIHNGRF